MNIRANKQVKILIALLVILGLTLYLGPGVDKSPTASAVQTVQPKTDAQPVASEARIRLDLIEKDSDTVSAGRENLFQYRIAQPAAARPPVRRPAGPDPFANASAFNPPPSPPSRPVPPPHPPINLKYQGYAKTDTPGGTMTAFLADESRHYNVTTGDVLMGRYRIVAVSDASVEVEDLQFPRRQTLPLLK